MTRKNVWRSGAFLLAGLAGSVSAQTSGHEPGATNAPGWPCGNRNLLRHHNYAPGGCGFAIDEHPNIALGTAPTATGVPFGDASWSVFDPNVWGWGSQSLNLSGFEISLGVANLSNVAGVTIQLPTIRLFPAVSGPVTQGPGGPAATALIPNTAGSALVTATGGSFFVPAAPCLPGASVGGNAMGCVLGLFYLGGGAVIPQPCTPTGPILANPTVNAPNGVAMVLEYPAGISIASQDRWTEYRYNCENYGLSGSLTANAGYFDFDPAMGMGTFVALPPTASFRHVLALDEPVLTARKLDATGTTILDRGPGAYYLSVSNSEMLGFRVFSVEGGTDASPGPFAGHIGFPLLAATPPGTPQTPPFLNGPNNELDLSNFLGFTFPGQFAWFNPDLLTFSLLGSLFQAFGNPGTAWVLGTPGNFGTVIWDSAAGIPTNPTVPVGLTIYLDILTLDLDESNNSPAVQNPSALPWRVLPTNTIAVHTVL